MQTAANDPSRHINIEEKLHRFEAIPNLTTVAIFETDRNITIIPKTEGGK